MITANAGMDEWRELAKKWANRKNGRRIAILLLLNSKGRMPAQKNSAALR